MPEAYPHLRISREERVNAKRVYGGGQGAEPPADIPRHAHKLKAELERAQSEPAKEPGYDERVLLTIHLAKGTRLEGLDIPELEIVSQEGDEVVVAFASNEACRQFEARLTSLASGELKGSRAQILYALKAFDQWSPADRVGWALEQAGWPGRWKTAGPFLADVELWPQLDGAERRKMMSAFLRWLDEQGIVVIDRLEQPSLIAARVRVAPADLNRILGHRDVRAVDLPPSVSLEPSILRPDLPDFPPVEPPPGAGVVLTVLDSGVATNHPLLKAAIGDAQGFLAPDRREDDEHGHGTMVAGVALYRDVEVCIEARAFEPRFWIGSGRILDQNNEGDPRFIENIVEEAVRYFHGEYGCRIFNLSYGDRNRPYRGRRVSGLAYVLDLLARELDVLFVVPTGNLRIADVSVEDFRDRYPAYLLEDHVRLLDPATSISALTVGALARRDVSRRALNAGDQRIEEVARARTGHPSPFTRCGPTVGGAIKPELVAHRGNWVLDGRLSQLTSQGLGVVSTSVEFAGGKLVAEECGTSFAAPAIAHLAARVRCEEPDLSSRAVRALLLANATCPRNTMSLLGKNLDPGCLVGFGEVDEASLYRSTEESVVLLAEENIADRTNQFYEVPIPPSFVTPGRRRRRLVVALGYTPAVRTTRLAYRETRLSFRLVHAETLEAAVAAADNATKRRKGTKNPSLGIPSIRELGGAKTYGPARRDAGVNQAATWVFPSQVPSPLFVVVSRNDHGWRDEVGREQPEPYALVVRLTDEEDMYAQLYTQAQALLAARAQQRVRVGR